MGLEQCHPTPIAKITEYEDVNGEPNYTFPDGERVTVAGVITAKVGKNTKSGDSMAFLTLEDKSGELEIVAFPKILDRYGDFLVCDSVVEVVGTVSQKEDEKPKILIQALRSIPEDSEKSRTIDPPISVAPAAQASSSVRANAYQKEERNPPHDVTAQNRARKLYVKVPSMEGEPFKRAEALLGIFDGADEVIFYNVENGKYIKANYLSVSITDFLLDQLRKILGDNSVAVK